MKVYRDLSEIDGTLPNPVVTMGNFDGIHRGHQEIFRMLREEAAGREGTAVVITFFPHPLKVLHPDRAPRLITTLEDRIRLIRACGMDAVLCISFTPEFAGWEPDRFVREILVEGLGVKGVLVGGDFRFGRDRRGDVEFLKTHGARYGFTVTKIGPVRVDGQEVSSTRIRGLVGEGRVREAARMLGRPFAIYGTVVTGDKRGKGLGFPTANMETAAELLPSNGVYAVRVERGGVLLGGVANLGIKPTFSGSRFTIEIHIFDFDAEIYGETLLVEFVERIREERAFPDATALVAQIGEDVSKARGILKRDSQAGCRPLAYPEKAGLVL